MTSVGHHCVDKFSRFRVHLILPEVKLPHRVLLNTTPPGHKTLTDPSSPSSITIFPAVPKGQEPSTALPCRARDRACNRNRNLNPNRNRAPRSNTQLLATMKEGKAGGGYSTSDMDLDLPELVGYNCVRKNKESFCVECRSGGMADTLRSGRSERMLVGVQIPPSAPFLSHQPSNRKHTAESLYKKQLDLCRFQVKSTAAVSAVFGNPVEVSQHERPHRSAPS